MNSNAKRLAKLERGTTRPCPVCAHVAGALITFKVNTGAGVSPDERCARCARALTFTIEIVRPTIGAR